MAGTNITVDEDFSSTLRGRRKKLFAKKRELAREDESIKTKIRYDKLIVTKNNKTTIYKVDESLNQVVCISQSHS